MRLPLPDAFSPVGPGGGIVTAMGGQNALLQQMLLNKVLQAQAQYAPAQQQGIAMQQIGQGQNALAQGRFAPQLQQGLALQEQAQGNILNAQVPYAAQAAQGNALQQLGLGTQEQVAGQYAQPLTVANLQQQQQLAAQAGLTTQQVQAMTNIYGPLLTQQFLQERAATQTAQAQAKFAPNAVQAGIAATLTPSYGVLASHPLASGATLPVTNNILGAIKNVTGGLAKGAGPVLTGEGTTKSPFTIGTVKTVNGVNYKFDGKVWRVE